MPTQSINSQISLIEHYRSVTVIGLGATGYSVVRYLLERGLNVTVYDSRKAPPMAEQLKKHFPDVVTVFGAFDAETAIADDLIVTSPGVSLKEPLLRQAKRDGAHIVGDIELFLQENDKPVIAVTGSNGKSTVVSLLGKMCEDGGLNTLVAGNIGKPALDALVDGQEFDVVILELSSFQLEATYFVPAESAAILNISADHMDRYDSMGEYVLAKARILRGAKRAILPSHDEWLQQISNANTVIHFELEEPASELDFGIARKSGVRWLVKGKNKIMPLKDVPLVGLHNAKNVLSAFALIDFLDLPLAGLVNSVMNFNGLSHRMQTIAKHNDVLWVNDSKATNVGATSTALNSLENGIIWLAGGQGKGADFNELKHCVNANIKQLILIGEDAKKIENAVIGLLPIEHAKDLDAAVDAAAMFRDFEHRGESFMASVERRIARGAV